MTNYRNEILVIILSDPNESYSYTLETKYRWPQVVQFIG